jgi:hypothetical protein
MKRFFYLVIVVLGFLSISISSYGESASNKGKLAVLMVFDQFRGDYLTRWKEHSNAGGFKKLLEEGVVFENCHYPYAGTITGAGHATLGTGVTPSVHGIVGNDWFDRKESKSVYCAASARYLPVPPMKDSSEKEKKKGAGNPERMLAPTLGDALKKATNSQGKVVSLSFKDRSAVMPAGFSPDYCFWFDSGTGGFQTSNYYQSSFPKWVKEFNESGFVNQWKGKTWEKFKPSLDYDKIAGPDDQQGEGLGKGQGKSFPHPFGKTQADYFEALYNSPFGNEVLFELMKKAVVAEKLGQTDSKDFLSISFSSNDPVGHTWGPDSQEVFDTTLRTDDLLNRLIAFLDEKVGRKNYTIVISADHGICPIPEVSKNKGVDAGRVNTDLLGKELENELAAKFGKSGSKGKYVESFTNSFVYFNKAVLSEKSIKLDDIIDFSKGWVKKQKGIVDAFGVNDFANSKQSESSLLTQIALSYHPDRCGDLYVLLKPYYVPGNYLTGTTHGSPHKYDTHVPLVVFGGGVKPGLYKEKVAPTLAAAILAKFLEIPNPEKCQLEVPSFIWK